MAARRGDAAAPLSPLSRWDHTSWYGVMGFHGIFWLSLLALAVFVVVIVFGLLRRSRTAEDGSALAVLDTRYARGEIDRGAYLERKRDLC